MQNKTIDDSLKNLLRERRFLFRGANTASFKRTKTNDGMYFGCHTAQSYITSTTLSLYYAMVNAHGRAESINNQGSNPILLAIDALPYVDSITKGLEWMQHRISPEGIVEPDEYEIHGKIHLHDVKILENLDDVMKFASPLTKEGKEKMEQLFNAFILRTYLKHSS